jgi:hypothetical protein
MVHRLSQYIAFIALVICLCSVMQAEENKYFESFTDDTFKNPGTLVQPSLTAAFSNWITKPAGFGTGGEGFGYHYGVALADNVNGKFMRKLVFAAASKHVDKYEPKGSGKFFGRFMNAAGHSIFVDAQAEHKSFNWSALPASFASAGLSSAYQPSEQQTWSASLQRAGTNSAGYFAGDLFSEFKCDIPIGFVRRLLRCKN